MDDPVLLTGASGRVGTAIRDGIGDAYDFRLYDREPPTDGTDHPLFVGDVTDRETLADAMADVSVVLHLAGDPRTDAPWDSVLRNNIDGTRTLYDVAVESGVEKVVFASSNHAVGMYEEQHAPSLYDPDYELTVDHESPLRPDSDYGASKAAGEAWCRLYAEREGIDCYALRIGSVRNPSHDHPFGDAEKAVARGDCERGDEAYVETVARMRCTWLSRRDCAGLVDACLRDGLGDGGEGGDGEDGDDGRGVDDLNPNTLAGGAFEVFYGISDNPNSWFDIEHARERVGYDPRDSGNAMAEPPE